MKKSNMKWLYGFVLALSILFIIKQGVTLHQKLQCVRIVENEIQSSRRQSKHYADKAKSMADVQTEDIRDTGDLQKISDTFLNEMFMILASLNSSKPKSSVATDQVVSAFLGATFGGDADEKTPSFHLKSNDIVYSKSVDGRGIGFGTVNYQQGQKEISITLLLHFQDGKINELQTGTVKDTSGRKS